MMFQALIKGYSRSKSYINLPSNEWNEPYSLTHVVDYFLQDDPWVLLKTSSLSRDKTLVLMNYGKWSLPPSIDLVIVTKLILVYSWNKGLWDPRDMTPIFLKWRGTHDNYIPSYS